MILRLASALAAALLAAGAARAAPPPWEGPAFSASPPSLRSAAEALPRVDGPVDVLVDEVTWRLDVRGAASVVRRVVYRTLVTDAKRQARVEASWSPWHQARPELHARVVAGDDVAELSAAAVSESAIDGSERRLVSAPLPGVRDGAIVEQVVTTRDTAPLFDGGVVARLRLSGAAPAHVVRLRLEAPAALPLRALVRGIALSPREAVKDGIRTIVVERRDAPAMPPPAPGAPPLAAPDVVFSWGRSWAEVAERYGALVDARLAGADLAAPLAEALGAGPRPARAEAIRRVLAFVRARVKAIPRGVGEAPLAPAAPRDVLARREASAQDVAALTVALLRAAGLDARVALVSADRDEAAPSLPGIGLLERPVVRVEAAAGAPATWLDPADPWAPPGRVAVAAEGRLALVAGKGTRALVPTPASRPEDNSALTVRTILPAELGPGRLVETRDVTGSLAASERLFRSSLPVDHRGIDARYAREVLGGTLVDDEREESDDRLRSRIEVEGSAGVLTGDDEAIVDAAPDAVFEPLPPFLGIGADAEPAARTADLELALPYRYELRYRIVPPEGFRVRAPLPADGAERFGPASLSSRFVLEKDGSVTATYRFDTGGRRLAARDADALVRRAREIVKGDGPRVVLERVSSALLAHGKVPEALAEIRRLAALHPREAMHPLHLALALVGLGYTNLAAEEARRAIALEPERAWARRVLGWVLEHDAVGRLRGPGFDRDGALAAYSRARALDPSNPDGRGALAGLLADRGSPADLASAIDELRGGREADRAHAHDGLLLGVLFTAGRDAEAVALARELPSSPERDAILVASSAIAEGPDRAETAAAALGEVSRPALANASSLLAGRRRHALAARLGEAAARGAPNAEELRGRAEMLASLRPWEKVKDEGDEATRFVKRLLVAEAASRDPAKDVAALVARRVRAGKVREALVAGLALPLEPSRGAFPAPGVSPDVALDVALSTLELARDGDADRGLRLRVRWRSAPGAPPASLYVAREGGALRIVASDRAWPLLGAEALRCADAGDLAGAARWLAWAREEAPGDAGDAGTPAGMVAALAPAGTPLDAAAARAAAAALVAIDDDRGELLPALREARAGAKDARARALATAMAAAAVAANRPADGLAAADDVLALEPGSRRAFGVKAWALRRLGRVAELDAAAEKVLAQRPGDPEVLGTLASTKLLLGDYDGAAAAFRRAMDGGRAGPGVYNDAAWLELFRAGATPTVLDWARRAAEASGPGEHAAMNTLAAVYASLGRAAEARDVFLRSLVDERPLEGADWFVFGRIAEAWGLDGAARAAYAKVEAEKAESEPDPSDAKVLARRRLEAMGAPVPAKGERARTNR